MTYYLYTDKPNKFNCNIEIEGTSLSKSQVRLVIETEEMSYMFKGKIENTGVCEVNIPKTKHFLPENTRGNMRLEVIADDVYFEPWSSEFNVKTNKKVNIVVAEQFQEEKPKLKVEVIKPTLKENETLLTKEVIKPTLKENETLLTKEEIIKLFSSGKIKKVKNQQSRQ